MDINSVLNYLGGVSFLVWIIKSFVDYLKQKRILTQQKNMSIQIEQMKSKQDSLVFMSNKQYEKEFEIYLELFESLANLDRSLEEMYGLLVYLNKPYESISSLIITKKLDSSMNNLNLAFINVRRIQMRYSPFFIVNIKDELLEISISVDKTSKKLIEEIMMNEKSIERIDIVEYQKSILKSINILRDCHERISTEVKSYLNNLKVKEISW